MKNRERQSCAFVHPFNVGFRPRRSCRSSSLRIFGDIRTSNTRESVEFSLNLSDVRSFQKALKRGHITSMHSIKLQFKTNSSFHTEILAFEYNFVSFGMYVRQSDFCDSTSAVELSW
jgi:hypothetical protein